MHLQFNNLAFDTEPVPFRRASAPEYTTTDLPGYHQFCCNYTAVLSGNQVACRSMMNMVARTKPRREVSISLPWLTPEAELKI